MLRLNTKFQSSLRIFAAVVALFSIGLTSLSAQSLGCIANVNVTLSSEQDGTCDAAITPQMVLTGWADYLAANAGSTATVTILNPNGSVPAVTTNIIEGCGTHLYMVEVFNANNESVYVCWGSIFAEDKTAPVIDCSDIASLSQITVAATVFDLVCTDVDNIFIQSGSFVVSGNGTVISHSSDALEDILDLTGRPFVTDNCDYVRVTVSDVLVQSDCDVDVITRTFVATDRFNSDCTGTPRTATCTQTITFRKLTKDDVTFPADETVDCDDQDAYDAAIAAVPYVTTAFGDEDIDPALCNLGVSVVADPVIQVCDGTRKERRTWQLLDWCNADGDSTHIQLVKVVDETGPAIGGVANVNVSTSPFSCEANYQIPVPTITDVCSSAQPVSFEIFAGGTTSFQFGTYVWHSASSTWRAQPQMVQIPVGAHTIEYCAVDDCGNTTCVTYDLVVRDLISPTASCDDQLNVTINSGDFLNGVNGQARIYATDVNEGSNDNCTDVTLRVRRNKNNCGNSSAYGAWGAYVDFNCCDVGKEITIELEVSDMNEVPNRNTCWLVVTPEDKRNPVCEDLPSVEVLCNELPLDFPGDIADAYAADPAGMEAMFNDVFNGGNDPVGYDNCWPVEVEYRTPDFNINECGWGSIVREFRVVETRTGAAGTTDELRSSWCDQVITIIENHDFVIDFPEDTDAVCGEPNPATISMTSTACDIMTVNISEPVEYLSGNDACKKFAVTYDVINWCLWDGEYTGYVVPRMTEVDGQLAADRAVEGNERPVIHYSTASGLCIDRQHTDRDGNSTLGNCNVPPSTLPNYGRYIYTQFYKVIDNDAPVVTVPAYGVEECGNRDLPAGVFTDIYGSCDALVTIPFTVVDECADIPFDFNLGDIELLSARVYGAEGNWVVDTEGDRQLKHVDLAAWAGTPTSVTLTPTGNGGYTFSGTYAIIPSAAGDNLFYALEVVFQDGCGNITSEIMEFQVIDCKGPAPVCINGLTVTLMPLPDGTDADGDGEDDACAMAIWASDFEGSPISDCTGQGPDEFLGNPRVTKYAIYRAEEVEAVGVENFVPSTDDTGLVLTDSDEPTTVVYVYAFDEEGNYDYCETYVLVQPGTCGSPTGAMLAGVITTEGNENIEGVEVNVSGTASMSYTTNGDGSFSFTLPLGGDYSVAPYLNSGFLNGVSTFDLVLMSKHILGVQPLNSPYKMIAADVNNSETITTLDMIQLRKLILNIETEFNNNTSWRFIPTAYSFPVPSNPWFTEFPEVANFNNLAGDATSSFVGVKIGDVNGSAQANALSGDDRTLNGQFNFNVANESLKAGNVYTVAFTGADMASVEGFQGTLALNGAELVDIEYGVATAENFGTRYAAQGMITTSWNGKATADDVLFSLVIRATEDAELSEVLNVSSRYTAAEAYGNGNTMNVGINFSTGEVVSAGFEVYQNTPNPFKAETLIGFNLPVDAEATVTITDASGRVLTVLRGDYAAGYNTINLTKDMIQGATGVLSYTVTAGEFTATKTMVVVK